MSATILKIRGEIELALEQYCLDPSMEVLDLLNRPQYYNFYDWINQKITNMPEYRLIYNHFKAISAGENNYVILFMQEIRNLRDEYSNKMNIEYDDLSILKKDRSKLKLLIGYLNISMRIPDLNKIIENKNNYIIKSDNYDDCSAGELRLKLFVAINNKSISDIFKIIGKLNKVDHDSGELYYLEALSNFHLENYDECIRYANKVKQNEADYKNSSALLLESYAICDKFDLFCDKLTEVGFDKTSPAFFVYLIQIMIINSSDPLATLSLITKWLAETKPIINQIDFDTDPFIRTLYRNTYKICIDFAIYVRDKNLERDLLSEPINDIEYLNDIAHSKYCLALNISMPGLADKILNSENKYEPIVDLINNCQYERDFFDFKMACDAQMMLDGGIIYLENVVNIIGMLTVSDYREDVIEFFKNAYIMSCTLGYKNTDIIYDFLYNKITNFKDSNAITDDINYHKLIGGMTLISKISYKWSCESLENAKNSVNCLNDAGMISLGFIRILENEMNNIFFENIKKSDLFLNKFQLIFTRLQAICNKDKTIKFWDDYCKYFVKIHNNELSGLDLGKMYILLEKIKNQSGDDIEIKKLIYEEFTTKFTTYGKESLLNGTISKMINKDIRDWYRNPPAHTRYLKLKTAIQCKQHVDESLKILFQCY